MATSNNSHSIVVGYVLWIFGFMGLAGVCRRLPRMAVGAGERRAKDGAAGMLRQGWLRGEAG
jgi:hypothetical protein